MVDRTTEHQSKNKKKENQSKNESFEAIATTQKLPTKKIIYLCSLTQMDFWRNKNNSSKIKLFDWHNFEKIFVAIISKDDKR